MGLREKMNENPKVSMGIAIGIVVLALVWLIFSLMPGSAEPAKKSGPVKCYLSEDDGKTYFPGERNVSLPAQGPSGKDAYIAHVYEDGYGKKVVGWLEKYTDEGNKMIKSGNISRQFENERLVKKTGPANKKWVSISSDEGLKIARPPDPDMHEIRP
jgi:hypothetical protein